MPEAKVLIEGQTIELDEEIAGDDETLRAALKPAWPDAANATFVRTTKDGVMTVKVVKKAGTKGTSAIVADLLLAPEQINPVLVMQRRLAQMESNRTVSHLQMLNLKPEIERAVEEGRAELGAVSGAKDALLEAQTEAGSCVPLGF